MRGAERYPPKIRHPACHWLTAEPLQVTARGLTSLIREPDRVSRTQSTSVRR
jgi:hypothetical protein